MIDINIADKWVMSRYDLKTQSADIWRTFHRLFPSLEGLIKTMEGLLYIFVYYASISNHINLERNTNKIFVDKVTSIKTIPGQQETIEFSYHARQYYKYFLSSVQSHYNYIYILWISTAFYISSLYHLNKTKLQLTK